MKSIFFSISLVLLFTNFAKSQLDTSDALAIDSIVNKLYNKGNFHGGILIAEGEQIIYEGAYGYANRNLKIPNKPNMRFWDASIGKMFTAVLILKLYEQDKLSLQDPISKHLSWFKHQSADKITIHDLLSHRSGFTSNVYDEREKALHNEKSQRSILENKISKVDLAFEPGTAYLYSNTGYVLLSEVIMQYFDNDFNSILQEHIFKPLSMNETYWSEPVYGPNMPEYYLQDGSPLLANAMLDFSGPGGEKTTLQDLHKFMLAVGTDKILSKDTWSLAFTEHSLPEEAKSQWGPHQSPYGYGFSIFELPYNSSTNDMTVSHGGAGSGTSSYALRFLETNRVIILWNNEFKNPMLFDLFFGLANMSSE